MLSENYNSIGSHPWWNYNAKYILHLKKTPGNHVLLLLLEVNSFCLLTLNSLQKVMKFWQQLSEYGMAKQNAVVILDTNNRKLNFFFMNHCSYSQTPLSDMKMAFYVKATLRPKKKVKEKFTKK